MILVASACRKYKVMSTLFKEIYMKKSVRLFCVLVFTLSLIACSRQVVQDTPQNTQFLMQNAINNQDYEAFQRIFWNPNVKYILKKI